MSRLVVVILAGLLLLLAGCGTEVSLSVGDDSALTYSVVPHKGGMVASMSDVRPARHTTWIVIKDDSIGRQCGVLMSWNDGKQPEGQTDSCTADLSLEAGTYHYAVYDVDELVRARYARYWTLEHLVAEGEVTVTADPVGLYKSVEKSDNPGVTFTMELKTSGRFVVREIVHMDDERDVTGVAERGTWRNEGETVRTKSSMGEQSWRAVTLPRLQPESGARRDLQL